MNSTSSLWQKELSQSFTKPADLLNFLELNSNLISTAADKDFPLRIPLSYANNIEKGNPTDPLLLQVLPTAKELINPKNYLDDPVGDLNALKDNCLIHKYHDRALFITTGGCAINCRFCFRRNFPYSDAQLTRQNEERAFQYLQENQHINELIFSGGDPLLLTDQRIQHLLQNLAEIPHIKRVRFHTRLPIVLPSRITTELSKLLQNTPLAVIIVTHCNHPNELSVDVNQACLKLKQSNITLLNQSVLLKNINNNIETLTQLSEKLFSCGILPYYLHTLDKAKGTAHFDIQSKEAIHLHQLLQKRLSGYLVPKLVKEEPGKASKTLLF
ncbi:MAG: EF-P beta-lysylation protein EpmB [Methyloprofundus sp.]|nr:EF-P beta-lysylation protein EpmB [Methyloprofundus sp.]